MNIGLYFGSFNPIHIGHLIIANHVINFTEINKIWFVVSPQNPLKNEKTLLNEHNRLHLVSLAIEDEINFKASNIEFKLSKPSYTVHTLAYLKEKYPQHKFSIIMGSDSFQNLPKWKNYETILNNYDIIVYKRKGYEKIEASINKQTKITILDAPILEISATQIRFMIKEKKSLKYLLPEKVKIYIENNNYYK